jgi:hypothetical protein
VRAIHLCPRSGVAVDDEIVTETDKATLSAADTAASKMIQANKLIKTPTRTRIKPKKLPTTVGNGHDVISF